MTVGRVNKSGVAALTWRVKVASRYAVTDFAGPAFSSSIHRRRLFWPAEYCPTVLFFLPYFLLQLVLFAGLLVAQRGLKEFLAAHSAIDDTAALEALKRVVRIQMYGALGVIALGLVLIPYSIALAIGNGLLGMVFVVVLSGLGFVLGKSTKTLEVRARTLPCAAALQAEYARVGDVWMKKALPRF